MQMPSFNVPVRFTACLRRFGILLTGLCLVATAAQAEPPSLTGIQLRKTHGAAGAFLTPVNGTQGIAGAITVEGRAQGLAHQVVFQFDAALMLPGTVSVTDETGAPVGSASTTIESTDVVVSITGIPDNKRVTVRLVNVNGQGLDVSASVGFLLGDVNSSRNVNGADVTAIKTRAGQPAAGGNAAFDLNASGVITAADIAAAKARNTRTLPVAYTLGGTVTGLAGSLTLQNNGGTLTVNANGAFTFAGGASGVYNVSVLAQPMGQYCTVSNAGGTIAGASVSSVSVSCVNVQVTTIYLIKTGNVANGALVALDNVLVTGVKSGAGYFVQVKAGDAGYTGDNNAAIFVSAPGGAATIAAGNRVNLIATLDTSGGGFQLAEVFAAITSAGEVTPASLLATASSVATGGGQAAVLEGQLVTVTNAGVIGTNALVGEFVVGGGLVVDDFLYAVTPLPASGVTYLSITGFLRNVNGVNKLFPRSAGDAVLAQVFTGALVTYVKPLVAGASPANDPAGFFVQSSAAGPSLFVAVDPVNFAPSSPAVGDGVSFRVGAEAVVNGLRQATAIDLYNRLSTGNSLASLVRNISSAADVASAIDTYQSSLVQVSGTISSAFQSAGSGYQRAAFATTGMPTGMELRLPNALVSTLSLANGCTVTLVNVPVWRTNAMPQISAWNGGDFTAIACPPPKLLTATPISDTTVLLQFDRSLNAASVLGDGSQFTIDTGLAVLSASVINGATVILTTATQALAVNYIVTVFGTVTDTQGSSVDPSFRSATFTGFGTPTSPVINEVDYDNVNTDNAEFIELYNGTGSAVDLSNLSVFLVNGASNSSYSEISLASAGSLARGEYLVIGPAAMQATLPPGTKFVVLPTVTPGSEIQNGAPDGIALVNKATGTLLDSLSYEGSITAATLGSLPGTFNLVRGSATTATDSNATTGSLCRFPNGTRTDNDATDWIFCTTLTPGAANTP